MTDLHPTTADLDAASNDSPVFDTLSLTVDTSPGGDGGTAGVGTDQDPTSALHVVASGDGGNQGVGTDQDPGGDGGSSGVGTDQDPRGDGGTQGVGTNARLALPPRIHALADAGGDGSGQGVGTDQDPGGSEPGPTSAIHQIVVT